MSLPRYPKYKDSSVAWLGEVPAHWVCVRLATLFREVNEPGNDDMPVLSVSIHDGVSDRELDENEMERKVTRSEDRAKYKAVAPGDLTYNMMRAWQGGFGTVTVCGMVSPAYVVARPMRDFLTSHIEMLLRTPMAISEIKRYSRGITDFRLRLYWEDFKGLQIALPPLAEQLAIASFLVRETGKIDALIAEQKELLSLLAEKRQATISHAVTRGLNPSAPMKESGVAWLGEVPTHWEVKPLRYCIDFQEGPGILAVDFHDEGVPLLRVSGVQQYWANLEGCNYLDPEKVTEKWGHFRVEKEDLLISASASMGTVCEVGDEVVGAIPYTGLIRLRGVPGEMTKGFIRHLAISSQFSVQIELLKAGATIQHFGPTHLSQMLVAKPPTEEQGRISEFVDSELLKLDTLKAEVEHAIDLLTERRSALITAAVTGKIDVRNAVPQELAA
ncbi:restriction endonuclease subunit S [Cupriavidus oxalaticus]|uniref:Restriction endonuclease subunit S n=1 Tax=Cupriavidus oxalaticus TaxID=96344 RepID=A0A5P3VDV8_9BURK|nr:restriction endonuclease subunit S [Cupriavidus oxalaticus]QEZ44128.1 restriction endonuclease subunit S [Cupriavidus oxalaticus]